MTDPLINNFFSEIDTGGGGDCLFRSLSYSLYKTPDKHFKVRQRICKAPIPQELEPFFIKSEREKMCKKGEWGTHLEVIFASKIYNKPIIVYKKKHDKGIGNLCEGYKSLDSIKNNLAFKGVRKYLFGKEYKDVAKRIYCIYLPNNNTDVEPILLYNLDNIHYKVLKPKKTRKSVKRKSKKTRKSVKRKSKKTRKSVKRKSKKTRKSAKRKSKKTRKSVKRKSKKTRESVNRKSKKTRKSVKRKSKKTRKSVKRKSKKTRKSEI
jgi:hypothetical protein